MQVIVGKSGTEKMGQKKIKREEKVIKNSNN
jgi:hypothetical protein